MRLDHLLSREPILGDAHLAGLVGCVFLVPALSHYCLGGGCGCVIGLGINVMQEASMLSGSRSTPCERLPPVVGGGCPRSQPVIVVLLVWVVCGGLFVICIVVASIFVLYCFLCFV